MQNSSEFTFHSTDELIADIRDGKMVVLVDDEDRENEGDLVLAAEHVTPSAINFMASEARGLICLALSSQQVEKLGLPQMVREDMNLSPNRTAFTISIEAAAGVSTGISAADRAHTIRVASRPEAKSSDITMPGHIFPIRAQSGGVLKRAGHTEGSVDLARLAGLHPAAVICEVMNPDGSMARVKDLHQFAKTHGLKIGTIVDLIQYRLRTESFVEEVSEPLKIPSLMGSVQVRVFRNKLDGSEHLVVQKGNIDSNEIISVRMQTDNYLKDFARALLSGEWPVLKAIELLKKEKSGILILLRGNNRPTVSQDLGAVPQQPMDERDYGLGAQILRALGVHRVRLFTNRPERRVGLRAYGIEIVETLGL